MTLQELMNKFGNAEIDEAKVKEVLGIKEKPSKIYKPKENDKYWCLTIPEGVGFFNWSNHIFDFENLKYGNCFRTEDEAQCYAEKLIIHRELEIYADEHNETEINWYDLQQPKFLLIYNYKNKKVDVELYYRAKIINTIYFTSEAIARDAIQYVGEDRIKEYYFDVNE